MCLNDNSATLSARYLNAQLSAMWENAVECVGHESKMTAVDLRSTEYNKHKYTRSLAQFHFAGNKTPRGSISRDNLFFDAAFGEPRLEFICNHEVALYLKLQNDHFNKSTWVGGLENHFHIRFSPPRVKALCKHEVVLYFTAAEVHFHESEDFSREPIHSFADWEFAFIVNVIEENVVGQASSLKLNLSSTHFVPLISFLLSKLQPLVFCQHLSTVLAQEVHIHFTHITNFLEYYYFELLATYNMHCIYYPGGYRGHDFEAPDFSGISEDESEWTRVVEQGGNSSSTVVWSETIKRMVLYGFDHMVAVSESSGCLAKWRYGTKFWADFSNIKVKLLSGDKALVTFTADHGHITLKDKRREYDFNSWTISYEVDIKMVDQAELHCDEDWLTWFACSGLGMHQHRETDTAVKHIILDFANAKYIYKHSSMPAMWDDGSLVAVDRLESFIYYMRKYLDVLSLGGHNIIHSTPIFPRTHQFGLTSASFQVVSKNTVTVTNCMFEHEVPVLMVVGMICGRPLPAEIIPWGSGWAVGSPRWRTTVVPRFPREGEEEWKVYLTTWDNHPSRKNKECHWKKVENTNLGWLEYAWEHRDEWSYEREGTRHGASGYSVLCHAKNQLCIPTMYRPRSMEIILRGESVLRLQGKEEKDNWSKRSSAKWSVKIHVNSEPSGLRVVIADQVQPVFEKTEGKWDLDPYTLLEEHLPRIVDMKEVVEELKEVFEGAWEYSYTGLKPCSLTSPVFTPNGDLVIQLNNFTEISTIVRPSIASPLKPLFLGKPAIDADHQSLIRSSIATPLTNGFLTTSSSSPLLTPPAVDGDDQSFIVDKTEIVPGSVEFPDLETNIIDKTEMYDDTQMF
ncbi:hypothetical protein C8F04DRAFT_1193608 [Mycena alexandri]|uniref:Uncharacterized protein n=1 Tax=Mycena alexandri TaxID=1745969 RepID=A0AAD6S8N1_9AGAR|nr:hypothetical protein C8F04DRAFT_1193608 [Mycena alexandri]